MNRIQEYKTEIIISVISSIAIIVIGIFVVKAIISDTHPVTVYGTVVLKKVVDDSVILYLKPDDNVVLIWDKKSELPFEFDIGKTYKIQLEQKASGRAYLIQYTEIKNDQN